MNSKSPSKNDEPNDQRFSPPSVSLPKGGGAIKGIGEKFSANPVTGTGSMSVPIATSPGRSGFGPQLSLSYDSGAGNGPFGFGWSLSLPAITRKTDKGLPQYRDREESDVFILSGSEDLVPELNPDGSRFEDVTTFPEYTIHRYRPRVEGLFARIERWTRKSDRDVHWRSMSRENILTLYGLNSDSRIADAVDSSHVFSWFICETRDDKGNAILYKYKAEDGSGIDLAQAHERNRGDRDDPRRTTNRYLKRIRYGNRTSLLDDARQRPPLLSNDQIENTECMFEVVLDYGEHDVDVPKRDEVKEWAYRNDPFSSYRAGFEVRTSRRCERILMFHHFPEQPEVGADCLVRSTDFRYADQDANDPSQTIYSMLSQVSQTGYKRAGDGYLKKSFPPAEFSYTVATIHEEIREVDPISIENIQSGLNGNYEWVDLDGEGLSGILTEQGEGWFYKRNLSPINTVKTNGAERVEARFAPVELVTAKPGTSLSAAGTQFLDLAGDGQHDLVSFERSGSGFYERTETENWESFRPFQSCPNVVWNDPNLRFVDLTGDGHADILITEDEVFRWYPSVAEDGFASAEVVRQAVDEERGPRLVFADDLQTIHLSDLSGDGLTDLVRIRNGEVCYWPNLGYGRFGAKVTMDNSPWFDRADLFNPRRLRLADIDGSGTTDLIYLDAHQISIYRNQSGNSWSDAQSITDFPQVDNLSQVQAIDLLGNGTACLVWSSPLPGHSPAPMRYIDLMGGQKPHLLVRTANNLGAETVVSYAPSTKFYLADKLAGKAWITKLPFPVHCVEKVSVTDIWRKTVFTSTYSYHHGYFDGVEREFRGFGRIEELDVESFGKFAEGNSESPYITDDLTLYQPPIKTVTWYHTGAPLEQKRILSQFEHEYFPRWFEDLHPDVVNVLGDFQENVLPPPDVFAEELNAEEWREALRACKGMVLREEMYELDVDALERGEQLAVKLFSTAYRNCHIRRIQAKRNNQHAVFFVSESEAITYHYELDLRPKSLRPDPRVSHTLNLQLDEYGNVLQSVAVVYPRIGQFDDESLPADALDLIHRVQRETHLAYSENRFTIDLKEPNTYRLRVPCEELSYELTGVRTEDESDLLSPDLRDNRYFSIDEFHRFRLSMVHQNSGEAIAEIPYHQLPNHTTPEKRLVQHARTLFFKDDTPVPETPMAFRQLGRLGLLYETYRLALTEDLLERVFSTKLTSEVLDRLGDASKSGYLSGSTLEERFPGTDTEGQYWVRSGIAGFAPDAAQHFYLPERYTDPFGNVTRVEYDQLDLFVNSSTDALGNKTEVKRFDFRVLAPREIQDINDNLSEVFFDALGLPTAMAVKGKGDEGDSLAGMNDELAHPSLNELETFFTATEFDEGAARRWLNDATARHVYYFGETVSPDNTITWGTHPACACGIRREMHINQLGPDEQSLLQTGFEYSDGMGSVVVTKIQAEPENPSGPIRWIANGKTILNNKGKPVKQFEPYFSPTGHRFEEPVQTGVTPVIFYDAVGRTVRTELPDGSFSRVDFSPWHVTSFDPNDTVRESKWFSDRNPPDPDQPLPRDPITGELQVTPVQRSAWLAAQHHNTPSLTVMDSLGRDVVSIAHNRVRNSSGALIDEMYVTFTKLDAEGKPLWIRDARKNLVMQYITPPVPDGQPEDPVAGFIPCYDIAGNLLFQHSMDAGDRWIINDAAGKAMLAWDSRAHTFLTDYDELHRPIASFVTGPEFDNASNTVQFEKVVYGDTPNNGLTNPINLNLRGKPYQYHDSAGIVVSMGHNPETGDDEAFDFKGNPLRSTRQLVKDYKATPDWSQAPEVETEIFGSAVQYDALNRPTQLIAPHSNRSGTKFNVVRPGYNEANLLERVDVWLGQTSEPTTLLDVETATQHIVEDIDYNEKGQRTLIDYGNRVRTTYDYDPLSFRLTRLETSRGNGFPNDAPGGIQNLSYFYDPVGNITRISDEAQQTIFFNGQKVEPSAEYEYDAIYRLLSATGREHIGQNASPQVDHNDSPRMNHPMPTDSAAMRNYTETYDYDPVGNILRMIHGGGPTGSWTRRYDYVETNNRLRATSLPGDAEGVFSAKYFYDEHGSMTSMPHLPLMQWDFRDQLEASSSQVFPNGTPEKTWYVYDAVGQRVRKVTDHQADADVRPMRMKERIYLGGFEIYREYEDNGNSVGLERETLHIMDDNRRVAMVETRTDSAAPEQLIRYQFDNHLGSATLELDDNAQIVFYEEYHPYGSTSYQAVRSALEVSIKRYRHTGMERDKDSDLYYHAARYYVCWLGRWVSCDPAGLAGGINLFCYTASNPIRYVDVSGNGPEELKPTPEPASGSPTEPGKASAKPSLKPPEAGKHPNAVLAESEFGPAWERALERRYKGGSPARNQQIYLDKLARATDKAAFGAAEYEKTQKVFKAVVKSDPVLSQYDMKDVQLHHIESKKGGPVPNPSRAVNANNLLLVRGNAAEQGTSHNRAQFGPGELRRHQFEAARRGSATSTEAAPSTPPASSKSAATQTSPQRTPIASGPARTPIAVGPVRTPIATGPVQSSPTVVSPTKTAPGISFKSPRPSTPAPRTGPITLDPAPRPGAALGGVVAAYAPVIAEEGARKLGASDTVAESAGLLASIGSGAWAGFKAWPGPSKPIGAVAGGAIGAVGYVFRDYELCWCLPF